MSNVVTVVSSPCRGSRIETVHDAVRRQLLPERHRIGSIPLRDLPESALLTGNADHPAIRSTRRMLADARGIVVIDPTYRASCSPLLRAWLDLLHPRELAGHVIQAISVGAFHSHASGADYTLRRVFAERGARRFAPACFLLDRWIARGGLAPSASGTLADDLSRFRAELARTARAGQDGLPAALAS